MNTNDCINKIHAAVVAKAKARCAVDGNNKLALEIGAKFAEYGAKWAAAFANDGKLDDAEERDLNDEFNVIITTYLPPRDGILVDKMWNGVRILGLFTAFNGIKKYLNKYFGLEIQ